MITTKDIIRHNVDGVEKTCIRLGSDNFALPKHLMQGEKKYSYILRHGQIEPFYWEGLITIDGAKYVYMEKMDIKPITEIATSERANALMILQSFALLLTKAPLSFSSSLDSNVIPLWRFYILPDGVMMLSEDISDIFMVMQEKEERWEQIVAFTKKGMEKGFSLISQFAQLLYYSLTSTFPYKDDDIRCNNYKEIPLSFFKEELFPDLDEKTLGFINFVLHAKDRAMRDIEGNRSPVENLSWFISRSQGLNWDVENLESVDSEKTLSSIKNSKAYIEFNEKTEKKAKRTRFWRVKGTIIIVSLVIVSCVLGFGVPYVKSFFAPPYTQELGQEEIIYAFYEAQNELNVSALQAPLKKVKAQQETEVLNLFVTTRTRFATENFDPVVRADDWLKNGKPAIKATSIIYGVTDIELEKVEDDVYDATAIWYTPYAYDDKDVSEEDGQTKVYKYKITQRFTFTWNERGWYNITGLEVIDDIFLGDEVVTTI